MNIADEEKFKLMFDVFVIKTVAGIIKAFHYEINKVNKKEYYYHYY